MSTSGNPFTPPPEKPSAAAAPAPAPTPAPAPAKKRRLKWEPFALMVILLGLSVWLVMGGMDASIKTRPGASTYPLRIGNSRGVVDYVREGGGGGLESFVIATRNGFHSDPMTRNQFIAAFGEDTYNEIAAGKTNWLFRIFNITTWTSFFWVTLGLLGQIAFSGRMLIQWFISEKHGKSTVPAVFWWLSLGGALALFAYFTWRQDVVGVLGQASGVVIYARNLRLIKKERLRAAQEV